MNTIFRWLDTPLPFSIGSMLMSFLAFGLGRFWQWEKDHSELERLYDLVSELTTRIANQIHDSIPPSPLAKAMIDFKKGIDQMGSVFASKIPATCIHGDNPDDCGICRH